MRKTIIAWVLLQLTIEICAAQKQVVPEFYIWGTVIEIESKSTIENATILFISSPTDTIATFTNKEGEFEAYLEPEKTYTILVSADNYYPTKSKESIIGISTSTSFVHTFYLKPKKEDVYYIQSE